MLKETLLGTILGEIFLLLGLPLVGPHPPSAGKNGPQLLGLAGGTGQHIPGFGLSASIRKLTADGRPGPPGLRGADSGQGVGTSDPLSAGQSSWSYLASAEQELTWEPPSPRCYETRGP